MKISLKRRTPAPEAQAGPDIAGLITGIQQQLAIMERKIDTLIGQASSRQAPRHAERQPQHVHQPQPQRQPDARQQNGFRERVLHKAVCADCHKECEVPFKPLGDRPVYCKECYAKRRSGPPPAARPPEKKHEQKNEQKPKEVLFVQEHQFSKQKTGAAKKTAEKKKPSARRRKR